VSPAAGARLPVGERRSQPPPNPGDIPTSAFWESARPVAMLSPRPGVRSRPDARVHAVATASSPVRVVVASRDGAAVERSVRARVQDCELVTVRGGGHSRRRAATGPAFAREQVRVAEPRRTCPWRRAGLRVTGLSSPASCGNCGHLDRETRRRSSPVRRATGRPSTGVRAAAYVFACEDSPGRRSRSVEGRRVSVSAVASNSPQTRNQGSHRKACHCSALWSA
jgi:hypothetical protein